MQLRRGKASHYHSRYLQARGLGPLAVSPPLVVDRKRGQLSPCHPDEWYECLPGWRGPLWRLGAACVLAAGLAWYANPLAPIPLAAAAMLSSTQMGRALIGFPTLSGALTQTPTALSGASGYTYNSAGTAIGIRVAPIAAQTLTSAYVHVTAFTGTQANVNDLNFELRNDSGAKPGATLHASGSVDPSAITAPAWVSVSGFSFSMSSGTRYWGTWTDTDQNSTDFATVLRDIANVPFTTQHEFGDKEAGTTTNGWNTITNVARTASIVLGCSGGVSLGNPYTAAGQPTSATNRKGINFNTGFTEQVKILGMANASTITNVSGMELRTGGDASTFGSSVYSTVISLNSTANIVGYLFDVPQTLSKATQYRLVWTYSASSQVPRRMDIGTGADATLAQAMLGGGGWYWAEASGTSNWTNDSTSAWPQVVVLIEDQVAVAGSSGGGLKLAGVGGLAG